MGIKGQPPLVNDELHKRIIVDDCIWTLEDANELSINLQKENKMEWWKCVCKGDPEINTQKVLEYSASYCILYLTTNHKNYLTSNIHLSTIY